MANLSKIKREKMLDYLEQLKEINSSFTAKRRMESSNPLVSPGYRGFEFYQYLLLYSSIFRCS